VFTYKLYHKNNAVGYADSIILKFFYFAATGVLSGLLFFSFSSVWYIFAPKCSSCHASRKIFELPKKAFPWEGKVPRHEADEVVNFGVFVFLISKTILKISQ